MCVRKLTVDCLLLTGELPRERMAAVLRQALLHSRQGIIGYAWRLGSVVSVGHCSLGAHVGAGVGACLTGASDELCQGC